jgi:hypothetical protein
MGRPSSPLTQRQLPRTDARLLPLRMAMRCRGTTRSRWWVVGWLVLGQCLSVLGRIADRAH